MPSADCATATDSRKQKTKPKLAKDTMHLVFLVFILHGIGNLLPWNLFINAKEYFENYKLLTNSSADADYRQNFMNYIGIASHLPNMLMSAINVFFQPTSQSKVSLGAVRRIMLVIVIEIFVCACTVALAVIDTSEIPRLFFDITMLSVVILNCCTAVYQSSVFGMAAVLPMKYSNAVVLGNNICGTLVAIVNIVCKAASTQNLQLTAINYFSFALLLLLLCLGSLVLLPRLKFYQQFHFQHRYVQSLTSLLNRSGELVKMDNGLMEEKDEKKIDDEEEEEEEDESHAICCCSDTVNTGRECFAVCCICTDDSTAVCGRYWLRFWYAFKQSWQHCISIWFVFFCTLACFPAIQSSIKPLQLTGMSNWFTDIFVFLTFNLFAMMGNAMTSIVQAVPPKWLAPVVIVRTILFIPFFLLCNCVSEQRVDWLPVLITNDFVFIIGMILFSFTSGYLSSLCMMYAPRGVKDPAYAGLAAMVAAFFLVFGIFSGISFGGVLFNLARRDS